MKKLIAAVVLLTASAGAIAAPVVVKAMHDCTGNCPDCPHGQHHGK